MKADPITIREIEKLVEQWNYQITHSNLQPNTIHTYGLHVGHFLRWCKDDFPIRGYEEKSD
ncbi:hypothetical protein GCM10028808_62440 [Spirosoma migulaei]